jgi:hypothetical protein
MALTLLVLLTFAVPQEPLRIPSQAAKPRATQEGEQKTEGLLQRVECPTGRPVTFIVKTADSVAKFQAPKLDAVEYTSATGDFKGPMTCGGRAAGDPVVVTWKEEPADAATKGGKPARPAPLPRAIAIEFTPKR